MKSSEQQDTSFLWRRAHTWTLMGVLLLLHVVSHSERYDAYVANSPHTAVFIPGHPAQFVTQLSDKLAAFAPELTLDFINEVSAGLDKTTLAQRINCLQYIAPWIKNIEKFLDPGNKFYEHSGTKFRDCVRVLIDLSIADHEVCLSSVAKYAISSLFSLDLSHDPEEHLD